MPALTIASQRPQQRLRAGRIIRVSTFEQSTDGAGLSSQYDVTDRIIAANNYELVFSIELVEVSGTTTSQAPEFKRLLAKVENRELEVVVAREISRIARPDSMEAMQVFDVFKRSGCLIAAGDLSIDFSSPDGWLTGGLHALLAGHDRMTLLRRMMASREAMRRQGLLASADFTLPTGVSYDREKRRFFYNDDVHKMVEAFRLLDEEGIRCLAEVARRVGLLPSSLRRLLVNEVYIGYRVYTEKANPNVKRPGTNGRQGYRPQMKRSPEEIIRVRIIDEPAVSPERFHRVGKMLKEIHYNYVKANEEIRYVNLCTVVGRCGICGQPLYSAANGRLHADGTRGAGFYACKSHHPRSAGKLTKCGSGWVRRETMDAVMVAFCRDKLTDPEFLTALITGSLARSQEVIVPFPQRRGREAIEALLKREKQVLKMVEGELLTVAEGRDRRAEIRKEIALLEQAAARGADGPPPAPNVEEVVRQVIRGAFAFARMTDRVEQKQVVASLFSEVFIHLRKQAITAFKFSAELVGKLGQALPTDIINLESPFAIREQIPEGHKRCPACKVVMAVAGFNSNQSRCRECQRVIREQRRAAAKSS